MVADVIIDTTNKFDTDGLKSGTVTVTDIIGLNADRLSIGLDGIDDVSQSMTADDGTILYVGWSAAKRWVGQSFQLQTPEIVTSVEVKFQLRTGTPTNVGIEIWDDSSGPNTKIAETEYKTEATINANKGNWEKFVLDVPIKLASSTTYYFIVRDLTQSASGSYYSVLRDATSTAYTPGYVWFVTDPYGTPVWDSRVAQDLTFRVNTQDTKTDVDWVLNATQLTDEKIASVAVTTTDADATNYVDKIEILDADDSDALLTTANDNIESATTKTYTSTDFNNGLNVTANKNYKMVITYVGAGGAVSEVEVSNISITYEAAGWSGTIIGVTDPAKIIGIDVSGIAQIAPNPMGPA